MKYFDLSQQIRQKFGSQKDVLIRAAKTIKDGKKLSVELEAAWRHFTSDEHLGGCPATFRVFSRRTVHNLENAAFWESTYLFALLASAFSVHMLFETVLKPV
jgi:hypothetical protein